MAKRLKPVIVPPRTREEMESLVGDIAALKIIERADAAEMDAELHAVRERYETRMAENADKLTPLLLRAQAWAEAHPAEFGKLKSIEMLHGTIGWRVNTPSLKTLAGWTWDRVLEKLKSLRLHPGYVRTKEEVNKQALLADREKIGDDDLRQCGMRVVQEEDFYVEPRLTDTDKRETAGSLTR